MKREDYHVCSRCVMDTSDPEISFDDAGVCSHCNLFDNVTSKRWFPNDHGKEKLGEIFKDIKEKGQKEEYDCIIGLSGGVDSSYLALVIKEYGLRPLVVHVDAGWNSELAVHNIEKIVDYCNFDLHTHVLDWKEVKDLQLAYLKAGVANQDVVQDHGFFAALYHFAMKNNIKHVISGGNIATECVFVNAWHHAAMDAINLKAIHKKFGKQKLRNYQTIGFFEYFFYYPYVKGMTVVRPLNFMPYHKENALRVLKDTVGYKEYGRKHGESRFTKFFQNHYLPAKFGMDKRRPHLSSQILSGELTRDEALRELDRELYDPQELADDLSYVAKKLGLTDVELNDLINQPPGHYSQYANWDSRYRQLSRVKSLIERVSGRNVKAYS